jgi:hypothetical protein
MKYVDEPIVVFHRLNASISAIRSCIGMKDRCGSAV